MNLFQSVTPYLRPKVELLSREGSIVAKGWVATDVPSKICHGKTILTCEKRVYVEEVIVAEAPIYERPQDGMMTMQEISEGFGGVVTCKENTSVIGAGHLAQRNPDSGGAHQLMDWEYCFGIFCCYDGILLYRAICWSNNERYLVLL